MNEIALSRGAKEFVTVQVTATRGDISETVTVDLAIGDATAMVTQWRPASVSGTGRTRTAALLLSPGDVPPGRYTVWVRVTSAPEVIVATTGDLFIT